MEPVCFLNGAIVPLDDAKVGVLDLSLLRGFGIYEGLAAHDGKPFRFHDHFARFQSSANALSLTLPFSEEETLSAICEVVKRNVPSGRGIIRMILTGGKADGGIKHVSGREMLYIIAEPMTPYPSTWYSEGARMITHNHRRAFPEYKTIDYTAAVLLQPMLAKSGAAEVLYTSGDEALECTGSNVFAIKDEALITPKDGILLGITRKVTIELATEAGLSVTERTLTLPELQSADEAFITSSFKDIIPIVRIDTQQIGDGAPGVITRDFMDRFARYAQAH